MLQFTKLVVHFKIAAIVLATHIHFVGTNVLGGRSNLLYKDMVVKAIPNDRQIHA